MYYEILCAKWLLIYGNVCSFLVVKVFCKCDIYVVVSVTGLFELGLDTEGLFRRSASAATLKLVQKQFNEGLCQMI